MCIDPFFVIDPARAVLSVLINQFGVVIIFDSSSEIFRFIQTVRHCYGWI